MKTRTKALLLSGALVVGLSAAAFSQTQMSPKPAGIVVGDAVTITATVVSIDRKDRIVALQGPAGNILVFEVDEAIKNFNKIKVGDKVKAEYFEAVAVYLGKPGTQPEEDAAAIVATSQGKKPGVFAVGAVDESALVKSIDKAKRTVTVTGPAGNNYTVHVDESISAFETLNVGDSIHIRYVEAIAIVVEKP